MILDAPGPLAVWHDKYMASSSSKDLTVPASAHRSGASVQHMKAQRHLALAVREAVPPEVMRDYHVLIAGNHSAQLYTKRLWRDPRAWEIEAVCQCCPPEEGGHPRAPFPSVIRPTQEERTRSLNWLADRGHGLPAQAVHVEQVVRSEGSSAATNLTALPPAAVFGILGLLRANGATGSGDAPVSPSQAASRIIEASAVEVERERVPVAPARTAPPDVDTDAPADLEQDEE